MTLHLRRCGTTWGSTTDVRALRKADPTGLVSTVLMRRFRAACHVRSSCRGRLTLIRPASRQHRENTNASIVNHTSCCPSRRRTHRTLNLLYMYEAATHTRKQSQISFDHTPRDGDDFSCHARPPLLVLCWWRQTQLQFAPQGRRSHLHTCASL